MQRPKMLLALALLTFGAFVFFSGSSGSDRAADATFRAGSFLGDHADLLKLALMALVALAAVAGVSVRRSAYDDDDDP